MTNLSEREKAMQHLRNTIKNKRGHFQYKDEIEQTVEDELKHDISSIKLTQDIEDDFALSTKPLNTDDDALNFGD